MYYGNLNKVAFAPHRWFRPHGHDLDLDLPLAPWEAALGTSAEIPTLEGAVRVRVPAGAKSGQKLRLAGRGLPKPDGTAGDLYAVLQVVVPGELSERERELYRQLAEVSSFDPRAHLH